MLKLRKSFTRRRSQASDSSAHKKVVVEMGVVSLEGQSHANEDRYFAIDDLLKVKDAPTVKFVETIGYAAVFDGHGGSTCSDYLSKNLHHKVLNHSSFEKFEDAEKVLTDAFKEAEEEFIDHAAAQGETSGSCAVAILFHETEIVVAHCGDCRVAMKTEKKSQDLTIDHRPGLPSEKARIKAAGGTIRGGRVQGVLAPSRSFGDLDVKLACKDAVIAVPDVNRYHIDVSKNSPTFLILASDGVFDAMASDKALQIIAKTYSKTKDINTCAKALADIAASLNSDDVTVIAIVYYLTDV